MQVTAKFIVPLTKSANIEEIVSFETPEMSEKDADFHSFLQYELDKWIKVILSVPVNVNPNETYFEILETVSSDYPEYLMSDR
jgi:hypothetical protein